MSEADELRAAQRLIAQGMPAQAQPALWKLYESGSQEIALNAGLFLLAALDQVTQNDVLLQVTDRSIATASALGKKDIRAFLLTQKAGFLFRELSDLLYREQNLKLAAKAFRWIDFSLQEDKEEYVAIGQKRTHLEQEIAALEADVRAEMRSNRDHYFQGKTLMGLAEISFHRFHVRSRRPCECRTMEKQNRKHVFCPSLEPRQADRLSEKCSSEATGLFP